MKETSIKLARVLFFLNSAMCPATTAPNISTTNMQWRSPNSPQIVFDTAVQALTFSRPFFFFSFISLWLHLWYKVPWQCTYAKSLTSLVRVKIYYNAVFCVLCCFKHPMQALLRLQPLAQIVVNFRSIWMACEVEGRRRGQSGRAVAFPPLKCLGIPTPLPNVMVDALM